MLPLLNGDAEAQRVEAVPEPHSRSAMHVAAPVPGEGKGEGRGLTLGVGGQLCPCPSPGSRRPSGPAISPSPRLPVWFSERSAGVRHTTPSSWAQSPRGCSH